MISYIKSNLFLDPHSYIAHGCNAQGVMGSGFALELKNRYPDAFLDYVSFCKAHKHLNMLGLVNVSMQVNGPIVFNCITQEYYGKDGKIYADIKAIQDCFKRIYDMLPVGSVLAMPKIGCGYGGLMWSDVEHVIKNTLPDTHVKVYIL